MKRSGADMRKRTTSTESETRPSGPLNEEEMEAVRGAYINGCRGEVVIGLRGDERIITMLVPEIVGESNEACLQNIRQKLQKLGCDGIMRVRQRRASDLNDGSTS